VAPPSINVGSRFREAAPAVLLGATSLKPFRSTASFASCFETN
jgi:hypothetical protein